MTVVYLSEKTASSKWVNWEIEESLKRGKGVIGVYKGDTPPARVPPAFQQNGCKAVHSLLDIPLSDLAPRNWPEVRTGHKPAPYRSKGYARTNRAVGLRHRVAKETLRLHSVGSYRPLPTHCSTDGEHMDG